MCIVVILLNISCGIVARDLSDRWMFGFSSNGGEGSITHILCFEGSIFKTLAFMHTMIDGYIVIFQPSYYI